MQSPFFFTFPLIVGAARSSSSRGRRWSWRSGRSLATSSRRSWAAAIRPRAQLRDDRRATSRRCSSSPTSGWSSPASSDDRATPRSACLPSTRSPACSTGPSSSRPWSARWLGARDPGRGFCLLMMDLDELKGINDRHGHHAGDASSAEVGGAHPEWRSPDRYRRSLRRRRVRRAAARDRSDRRFVLAEKIRLERRRTRLSPASEARRPSRSGSLPIHATARRSTP